MYIKTSFPDHSRAKKKGDKIKLVAWRSSRFGRVRLVYELYNKH